MLRSALMQLARRPVLAAGLLFLVGFAFTALPSLRYGPPLPALHDEYADLFLGETLARGRLTNPPPPGPPEFYQTFHEFISPRYVSKFPPGPGIALALGIWLGHPIIGVWIVNGLWAVALYWMLRAVVPPGWALGGALAGVVSYGAMSYWGYSYWGGSVFALGGTLAFGGALRCWKKRGNPLGAAAWAGVGCGIMALTRPLDGFIFALGPAAVILWTAWRDLRLGNGVKIARSRILGFGLPAAAGVALMLGYNMATTGSALTFAHRLYDETFLPRVVLFVWEKPGPDPANQPNFLTSYEDVYATNMSADPLTAAQYWTNLQKFATAQFHFLFPYWLSPLALIALGGIFFARDRTARLALLSLLFIAIPLVALRFYGFSHYIAAWTAPALLLLIQGARRLRAWGQSMGGLPCLGCVACALLVAWPACATVRELTRGYPQWLEFKWVYDREQTRQELADLAQQTGHKQLALVIYAPGHDPHAEWVYNSPDPGAQDVLWLRALGPSRVAELPSEFPGYDDWFVYVTAEGKLDHREKIPFVAGAPSTPAGTAK